MSWASFIASINPPYILYDRQYHSADSTDSWLFGNFYISSESYTKYPGLAVF